MNTRFNSRGFSLIEVMVALLVLALGILGISKLQGTLIRSSSDANQRAVAVSIAQEKIDDLKSFSKINTTNAWTVNGQSSNLTANNLAFVHIDDNTGGAPTGTENLLANQVISRGNANYTLTWDVTDYEFQGPMTAASLASSSIDFKEVTIDVSWIDEISTQQSVSLSTIIDSRNPALISLSGKSKQGGVPPVAEYSPEEAPDVIDVSVDTGGNKFRQTSKPLPDAISQGQNANTVVSFDVVTYSSYNGPIADLDFVADTLEEYVTVDCQCQFSTSNSVSRAAAHVQWDPETNTRLDYPGDLISKQTATPTGNVNAVEELCTTCCRDHHDVNDASKPVYVPGTTEGNHDHYQADGITLASQASGDTYVESCRMKRIDGIYRVFQDWNLYDLTVIERGQLSDTGTLQGAYSNYVKDFVLDFIVDPDTAVKPSERSPVPLTEGAGAQLQSRGIFIDNVYDDTGSVNPTHYITYVNTDTNTDRVDKIPFAEVNLTLLSNWSSSNTNKLSVTNEPVATIPDSSTNYYGLYSRGFIVAQDATDPDPTVTSFMRRDNDGLTQLNNKPMDNSDIQTDSVDIDISEGEGPITLTFTFDGITYPGTSEGTPELTITGGGVCNSEEAKNSFTCFVTAPWTGTAQITVEVTSGPQIGRCTGESSVYSPPASLEMDTTHNFGVIDCN